MARVERRLLGISTIRVKLGLFAFKNPFRGRPLNKIQLAKREQNVRAGT